MTETLQEFLRRKNLFSPQREVKEFPRVIDLEQGLSVSIVQRLEIVGSTSTHTVRPGYMKSLFKNLSFEGVPFIRDIADGIRFREMIGGFASKVLSTRVLPPIKNEPTLTI